jgi:hypothetical protein
LGLVSPRPLGAAPRRPKSSLVLATYWLGAGAATLSILWSVPWPSWAAAVAWGVALAAVPVGYAAFLWPRALARSAASIVLPLLGEPRSAGAGER